MKKHTKLFYKAIARLRVAKPDYLAIMAIKKRFKTGYLRAYRVREELQAAGVVKEIDINKESSNINWDKVNKIRVPNAIAKEAKSL